MALGPSGERALDAERPHPGPPYRNAYERTKAEADRLAREAAAAGQDVVILYPGVIYGPGEMTEGNIVARLVADHLNGRLPALVGPGDRRWSYAFVDDVARGPRARARARPGRASASCSRARTRASPSCSPWSSASPATPPPRLQPALRRRLGDRPAAVAVGRAHRPPAAADAGRGGCLPRALGLRQRARRSSGSATARGRSPRAWSRRSTGCGARGSVPPCGRAA